MSFGLQNGTTFAGRYAVVRCIAAGAMGAVYEVVHLETQRRRALKVMLPQIVQSAELRERFKQEARVAALIESEFIVDVFDAGIDEATQMPFLVMELLRGEELGKLLARRGRLFPLEVVTYLQQTALALDKTHKASVVHRDLKPENLFLTEREDGPPRIKVLDFGVAKVIAESFTANAGTRSLGTPLYMAPEQFNPMARLTGAADIHALGMIAYSLLIGVPYWDEEARRSQGVVAFAMIAVHGPPERATARAARRGVTLSPAFDLWFARATSVDPTQRFPTATAAVAALAEAFSLPCPKASSSLEQGDGALNPGSQREISPSQRSSSQISQSEVHPLESATSAMSTLRGAAMTGRHHAPHLKLGIGLSVGLGLLTLGGAALLLQRSWRSSPGVTELVNTASVTSLTAPSFAAAPSLATSPATGAASSVEPSLPSSPPAVSASRPPLASTSARPPSLASTVAAPQPSGRKASTVRPTGSAPRKAPGVPVYSQD